MSTGTVPYRTVAIGLNKCFSILGELIELTAKVSAWNKRA